MYKILVVDDEPVVREGIIRFLTNHSTGFTVVGEAADGREALELFSELLPDVIIADIEMPLVNGIELIEQAQTVNPDLKVLIVSGYDDFEYAQRALRLGVFDYLLKPVDTGKLLDALSRVGAELDERCNLLHNLNDLQNRVQESLPVLRDHFFRELLAGKVAAVGLERQLSQLDLNLAGSLYAIALLKVKKINTAAEDSGREGWLQCSLMQIAESIFPASLRPYCFFLSEAKLALLVVAADSNRQRVFITINRSLQRIIFAIQRYLGLAAYAALGSFDDDLPQISRSYLEADEALRFSLLKEKGNVINYEEIHTGNGACRARPVELEKKLLSRVKLGEGPAAQRTVALLFGYYRGLKDIEPTQLKQMVLEVTVLLRRMVEEAGGMVKSVTAEETSAPYDVIQSCDNFQDLETFLADFTQKCLAEIAKVRACKNYTLVEQAKELVETALGDSDLAMDSVAARLFISPNYLRSLFKQEVGESFVEYVTRLRMERARQLLDDGAWKVSDLAARVGYSDQHYFSMCFKKYFGLTPSDYRELRKDSGQ